MWVHDLAQASTPVWAPIFRASICDHPHVLWASISRLVDAQYWPPINGRPRRASCGWPPAVRWPSNVGPPSPSNLRPPGRPLPSNVDGQISPRLRPLGPTFRSTSLHYGRPRSVHVGRPVRPTISVHLPPRRTSILVQCGGPDKGSWPPTSHLHRRLGGSP